MFHFKKTYKSRQKAILAIAVPAIVTNITTPILGMVDIAIAGHIGTAEYIGAIAVGSSLFSMIYWIFIFLRASTSGLTAQSVGAKNLTQRDDIFYRSIVIGFLIGLTILIFSPLIGQTLISFMQADAVTSRLADVYFKTVIWGAPAYLGTYALTGWLIGNQNTVATLRIAIATNLLNIALSLIFVFALGMRLEGVALGTALSQWAGFIYGLFIVIRRYAPSWSSRRNTFQGSELSYFFKLNLDIFLRTLCLVAVTVWFTRTGAKTGAETLAANALLMQLFMFFSFFMDGFAYAGEAIAGKELGAGNYNSVKILEIDLIKWGFGLALLGVTIYFLSGEFILSLLTKDVGVKETAKDYLPWAITIPLCGFMAFIYDGIFIGMSLTRKMLFSMFVAITVFFLTYFLLYPIWGNHALWLAFSFYLTARGIAQYALFLRYKKTHQINQT